MVKDRKSQISSAFLQAPPTPRFKDMESRARGTMLILARSQKKKKKRERGVRIAFYSGC